jgi:hypothetical protein
MLTDKEHKIYYDHGDAGVCSFVPCAFFYAKDRVLLHNRFLFVFPVLFCLSFAIGQTDEREYIVRKGDTLWDISFRFLGDPFSWPQLWHQNPQIKDPNLIYPDDRLTISKTGQGRADSYPASDGVNASSAAKASSSGDPFFSETKQAIEQSEELGRSTLSKTVKNGKSSDSLFELAMHKNSFFTGDFLEKIGFLWFKKDEKGQMYPGNAVILRKNAGVLSHYEPETYQQFDDIVIQPYSRASYHVGDTVSIVHADRFVKLGPQTANCVRRTGRARITGIKGATMTAVLIKAWDVVENGDRVDTLAHFADLAIDTLVDPVVTIRGSIVIRIENTERPYLYHTCIIDRGSKDGVVLGDMFAIISGRAAAAGQTEAVACAVNIGETSSTLVIEKMFDNNINPGDTAVIIKRIQFKK